MSSSPSYLNSTEDNSHSEPTSADVEKQSLPDHNNPLERSISAAAVQKGYTQEYEVSWDGESDPENPRLAPSWRKWVMVLITSSTALCVTCTSSLYTSTYDQITVEFRCSNIVATLGLSLFVIGLGLSPMVLGPLSEFYGRRPIYIWSMFFFIVWLIPCAVAQNIQTMLVARFFNGFAGAAFLTVAGGTVSDLFDKMDLQAPMMVFTASPFLGPVLGPVLGGFINQFASWRWSFYVLIIWSFTQSVMILAFVPETFHPVILRNKARRMRKETGQLRFHAPIEKMDRSIPQTILKSIYRPFLLLTREPMMTNLCLLSALLLGIIYLFFGAFTLGFRANHNFELWQVGLSFSGIGVGMIAATATDHWWHQIYLRLIKRNEKQGAEPGSSEPEFRLAPAILGTPLVTIGLFWFGWTTSPTIHWIVPIIGSGIFGAGYMLNNPTLEQGDADLRWKHSVILVYSGVFTFSVDAYPSYAASALAANSFARSSFAAAFPLFGIAMYEKLGFQWATSLLAFLSLAMAPFPFLFFKYGKKIRQGSKYAASK